MDEKKKHASADANAEKAAEAKPDPVKRTPREWAHALGLVTSPNPQLLAALGPGAIQTQGAVHWKHAAASELFGWERRAYHYQVAADRFEITEERYRAALDAAAAYPCCELPRDCIPETERERFKNFVPRASRKERS